MSLRTRAIGGIVVAGSLCAIAVRFSAEHKANEEELYLRALAARDMVPAE